MPLRFHESPRPATIKRTTLRPRGAQCVPTSVTCYTELFIHAPDSGSWACASCASRPASGAPIGGRHFAPSSLIVQASIVPRRPALGRFASAVLLSVSRVNALLGHGRGRASCVCPSGSDGCSCQNGGGVAFGNGSSFAQRIVKDRAIRHGSYSRFASHKAAVAKAFVPQ